jgi:hypothetical protein
MAAMRVLRLRLRAAPDSLEPLAGDAVLDEPRSRLRQMRGDAIILMSIEREEPSAIAVAVLVTPAVRDEDLDAIARDLREALGIGPGTHEWRPGRADNIRGPGTKAVPPETGICPVCSGIGGEHYYGCPEARS